MTRPKVQGEQKFMSNYEAHELKRVNFSVALRCSQKLLNRLN